MRQMQGARGVIAILNQADSIPGGTHLCNEGLCSSFRTADPGWIIIRHTPRPVHHQYHIDRVRLERPAVAPEADGDIDRIGHVDRPGDGLRLHGEVGVVLPGQGDRPGGAVPRGDDVAPAPGAAAPLRILPIGRERARVESDGGVAVAIGLCRGLGEVRVTDLHEPAGISVPDREGHVLSPDRVSFLVDDLRTEG